MYQYKEKIAKVCYPPEVFEDNYLRKYQYAYQDFLALTRLLHAPLSMKVICTALKNR